MRASRYLISTLRETPNDAEVVSHQLMLRAGMIRRLSNGLYNWLPLGLRVLHKVEAIIREEMNRSGALEVMMPVVQPLELWQESGREEGYGAELLRFRDRHDRPFVLGPTHEEVITDLARQELNSYKQLPVNFYQIQTKFRDEIRPRFGVMRSREFIMKDAYSFHASRDSLAATYQTMYDTYTAIFTRLGLDFRAVEADTGAIGGFASHEFQVLADSGEDAIAISDQSDYAANIEMAQAVSPGQRPSATQPLALTATPGCHSISDVSALLGIPAQQTLKVLAVQGAADEAGRSGAVLLVLRGDHELNTVKAEKHPLIASPLTFADTASLEQAGLVAGFIGPQGQTVPVIADSAALLVADAVVGGNQPDQHATGFNWERDAPLPLVADLRNVVAGDPSPDGQGNLVIRRGIEVGHIFQLGEKYAKALGCTVLGEDGKPLTVIMGCYGIGVTRVVAAAIEQNHDERGIIWPDAIAPFQVVIVPMNAAKSPRSVAAAESLYLQLQQAGLDVLLDDRAERPGVKFNDAELIGIPHRIVVSERGLDAGTYEYQPRRAREAEHLPLADLLARLGVTVDSQA